MRTSLLRSLFLLAFVLVFAHTADAAWAVTGRVVDPDGRAVRGATVLLVDGTTVVATAVTDATGAFTIDAPHDGPFEVHTSVNGLGARPVSIRGNGDTGPIKLEVSAVRESVVVSAAQVDIPLSTTSSSVTVLTSEDLAALQVRDLPDALRLTAGLTIVSTGGYGAQTSAFPRGGESDYSLVFIDGVQANAFGGGFDFAHVPVMNIERVEIVRGPQGFVLRRRRRRVHGAGVVRHPGGAGRAGPLRHAPRRRHRHVVRRAGVINLGGVTGLSAR